MANQEQLRILEQGVEAWNDYRKSHRRIKINLRGANLSKQNLSGADFSEADIRSTNFSKANLTGANFISAKAGLSYLWLSMLAILTLIVSVLSAFLPAVAGAVAGDNFTQLVIGNLTNLEEFKSIFAIVLIVITFVPINFATINQGLVGAFAGFVVLLIIGTIGWIPTVLGSSGFQGLGAVAVTIAWGGIGTLFQIFFGAIFGASFGTLFVKSKLMSVVGIAFSALVVLTVAVVAETILLNIFLIEKEALFSAVIVVSMGSLISCYVVCNALAKNKKYILIHDIAIAFSAYKGTSFKNTTLTDANFSFARFKSTDMRKATLTLVCWHKAQMLNRVLPGYTYLKNTQIRQWLIGEGTDKNFDGQDLRGINLQGANLTDASFIATDLSGAGLSKAILTGATIQDWNINNQTKLDDVICNYVYLKKDRQERLPHNLGRTFKPGEFAKYIEKALNTVDLIFTDGIDWKAFFASFQTLQDEYGAENIGVQAIERKSGGAFVVRIEVPPDAIKAEAEASFWQQYNPLLEAKDREIQWLYEQKEFYVEEIKDKREEIKQQRLKNTELTTIIKTMAEKDNANYDLRGAKFGGGFAGKDYTGDVIHNYASEQKQTLAEAADEIQKLLQQLEISNPTATEADKIEHINDETIPKFKRRAASALKAAGDTAIDEFLDNSYVKVGKAAIMGWIEAESNR